MKAVIFLILSLFSFSAFPQLNKSGTGGLNGFRGIPWGAPKDTVKIKETNEYLQSFKGFGIESISYRGTVSGLDCRIDYTFREGKLTEGMYSLVPQGSLRDDFKLLYEYLSGSYGMPRYMSGRSINDAEIWIKKNNYGRFQGPALYWIFNNGFIALQAARFKDDIKINIIFAAGKNIAEYGSDNIVPAENYAD